MQKLLQLTCRAVQDLRLKEDARVPVSYGGQEESFGLAWPSRDDHLHMNVTYTSRVNRECHTCKLSCGE